MSLPGGGMLLYMLIPIAATIGGGVVAAFRTPGDRLRSLLQHFAGGVVFAAAAGEILPDVMARHERWGVVVGFAVGIGAMLLIRSLARGAEEVALGGAEAAPGAPAKEATPTSLLVTLGVDIFIDGLLLGIGFAAGAEEGILLMAALTLELLFLGLAAATALGKAGSSRGRIIGVTSGLAVLVAVGAGAGLFTASRLSSGGMEVLLSFGLAALLYLVTEELLVEAHEVPETPWATATFFLGFVVLLLMEMSLPQKAAADPAAVRAGSSQSAQSRSSSPTPAAR